MKPTEERSWLDNAGVTVPYWLAVGTIEPRKNLISLLEANQLFRESGNQQMPLSIVGERGWKSDAYYEMLAKHPFKTDIHLSGFVADSDLASLYSHARGLIYPSIYEGFGLPVLEAMSCGCPVICSSVSSLPEVGGDAVSCANVELRF
jgi:alpha-1,3-rhamnosyl/mannosyltransferase